MELDQHLIDAYRCILTDYLAYSTYQKLSGANCSVAYDLPFFADDEGRKTLLRIAGRVFVKNFLNSSPILERASISCSGMTSREFRRAVRRSASSRAASWSGVRSRAL